MAIDAEVDLCTSGGAPYFQARFTIPIRGLERDLAQAIADAARGMCPIPKPTRGIVDLTINLA